MTNALRMTLENLIIRILPLKKKLNKMADVKYLFFQRRSESKRRKMTPLEKQEMCMEFKRFLLLKKIKLITKLIIISI